MESNDKYNKCNFNTFKKFNHFSLKRVLRGFICIHLFLQDAIFYHYGKGIYCLKAIKLTV